MTDQNYLLFSEINKESAKGVVEWILNCNADKKPHKFLVLVINSDGGNLSSAFSIIDMMNCSKIPVRTIATGEAQSSGLMISMNGEKGSRFITQNTSILTHTFNAGSDGKFHDLNAMNREHNFIHDRMVNHYIKCTGLTKSKIEKTLLKLEDVYLTPQEALQYGLCDSLIT